MLDLIVLNYNDYPTTSTFIENVSRISVIDHIIVVDNYSSDDSYDMLNEYQCDRIDVIRTNMNAGYANGNNFGAYYAIKKYSPDYLVFANPDVIISSRVLIEMLTVADKINNLGCITVRMKCTSGINLPVAWRLPTYRDCILENLIILKKFIGDKTLYSDNELDHDVCNVDAVPGSFFMIKAKTFSSINGFDGNTFLYYEENILATKIKKAHLQNILIMNEEYIHNHSVSINKSIKSESKRLKLAYESREYYCTHYLKINNLQKLILKISFLIGKNDYLLGKKFVNIVKFCAVNR